MPVPLFSDLSLPFFPQSLLYVSTLQTTWTSLSFLNISNPCSSLVLVLSQSSSCRSSPACHWRKSYLPSAPDARAPAPGVSPDHLDVCDHPIPYSPVHPCFQHLSHSASRHLYACPIHPATLPSPGQCPVKKYLECKTGCLFVIDWIVSPFPQIHVLKPYSPNVTVFGERACRR